MFLRALLSRAVALLLPLTLTATVYLYLYPLFKGCAFPLPQAHTSQPNSLLQRLQQYPVVRTLLYDFRGPDATADPNTQPAIFRLLVLADPQLEGDTSLPLPEYELVPRVRSHWRSIHDAIRNASTTTPLPLSLLAHDVRSNITTALTTLVTEDIPRALRSVLKRIDLVGNDYYLAHIYRTLFWWTRPTHTTVLGDLVGSQWVTDEEYAERGERYWKRVFQGGERVDDEITKTGAAGYSNEVEILEPLAGPEADPAWARRIINIAGNHDIGYAGDISEARMERFERVFGRANWDIRFQHPPVQVHVNSSYAEVINPTLHLINLNSLILDTPALSPDLQTQTYAYLNDIISHRSYPVDDPTFTLLLTHVPLHKKAGICTDEPYFDFHYADDDEGPDEVPRWKEGGLKEQNHLSDHASAVGILQGIFGMSGDDGAVRGGRGRNGLILTGHDHTGCDVVHYVDRSPKEEDEDEEDASEEKKDEADASWRWSAQRYSAQSPSSSQISEETPSIREVTLRSMMGEFGGNAGLLSVWFDSSSDVREWKYAITMCPAGVQHIWWAVHILLLITVVAILLNVIVDRFTDPGPLVAWRLAPRTREPNVEAHGRKVRAQRLSAKKTRSSKEVRDQKK
ncbi:hypothetical protein N7474_009924 [Penicillium riverlandense]|uniref:uncharacterized protein n=1 Tax=Penicillium riverlandense TaxID=1903569 RepID=UPI0025494BE2|nr:uncharacterized protein N7474_009924 [Penicillium riverlandense]KAJ5808655.1 hypothetical protein N7474_009924 [Penicillium riverlandense]